MYALLTNNLFKANSLLNSIMSKLTSSYFDIPGFVEGLNSTLEGGTIELGEPRDSRPWFPKSRALFSGELAKSRQRAPLVFDYDGIPEGLELLRFLNNDRIGYLEIEKGELLPGLVGTLLGDRERGSYERIALQLNSTLQLRNGKTLPLCRVELTREYDAEFWWGAEPHREDTVKCHLPNPANLRDAIPSEWFSYSFSNQ